MFRKVCNFILHFGFSTTHKPSGRATMMMKCGRKRNFSSFEGWA